MDYTYHDYAQADPPHQPLYLDEMVRVLRRAGAKRVLDAGCGDGNFTASLAEAGFEMFAIDLSEGGISRAQARYPNITFCNSSVYDNPLEKFHAAAPFDAIVSIEVIEHLYSPMTFMKQARAALKPGGLLILTTPYWGYLKNVVLALTNRTDRALSPLWEGGHIKHWSVATLKELGRNNRFEFQSF
jgi:2-polyprenyl-3-methyl-5-hydroxy-6-metoxy-1,4-benzoquinol methylase